MYICPFCGSGNGSNGTGALKYYSKTNDCYCFSCNKKYDIFDLYMNETGSDYLTALNELAAQEGITIDKWPDPSDIHQDAPKDSNSNVSRSNDEKHDENKKEDQRAKYEATEALQPTFNGRTDYTEYYIKCAARITDPEAAAYLSGRGISIETAKQYGIGYDPQADPANNPGGVGTPLHPCKRIIVPTSPTHYVGRSIDPNTEAGYRKMNPKNSTPGLFNDSALYQAESVFVVEGVFDALSILEAGADAIALNSTSNAEKLIKQLQKHRTEATVILCCDNDNAGKEANAKLRDGLQRLNIAHITADICGGYKDPNEYLQADRKAFSEAVEAAKVKAAAKPDNVRDYISQFMGDDIQRFKNDIKTGYRNLDEASGGLYSGFYVVAAISSLGKTTFCAQMADQIAASGHDVLYFSLEQSRLEMVSKSLARITAQTDPKRAVTSLQIRKGQGGLMAEAAARAYIKQVGDRLSIIEGNFNCDISFIGDYIRQYIRRNQTRPVVFIDYLQILQPIDTARNQTTKEIVDTTVTELKRLSRELNLTIFAICSVNRTNYLTPIDFESLKESGNIEYTADVVYGLQLQCINDPLFTQNNKITEKREMIKAAKAENPRRIQLICLKNRYGIASYSCNFKYFPANDLFEPEQSADIFQTRAKRV